MAFEDDERYILGEKGEQLVEEVIKQDGWHVLPSRHYAKEGAPSLQSLTEEHILPDLWVAKGYKEKQRFVEVKTKSKPIEYGIENETRHGFDARLYDDYREVQKKTGCDVWIFLYETCSGELLRKRLESLAVVQRTDKLWRNEEAVMFRRDDFDVVELEAADGLKRTFGQAKLGEQKTVEGGVFGTIERSGQTGLTAFTDGGRR